MPRFVPTALSIALLALLLAACGQDSARQQTAEPAPAQPEATDAVDTTPAPSPDRAMVADEDLQVIEEDAPADGAAVDGEGTLVAEEVIDDAPATPGGPGVIRLAQADSAESERQYQEGRHYRRLSPAQPTSSPADQVEVAEVFWYGCPHCYEFEPHVRDWQRNAPDGVNVVGLPAVWNPLLQMHARLYYTAQALDVVDRVHMEVFREIHDRGNMLDSEDRIRSFFSRHGVSGEDFDRAWNSFNVQSRLQRAEQLGQRYRVTGTPMLVVNGKYTIDGRQAGGLRQMLSVADELVRVERTDR